MPSLGGLNYVAKQNVDIPSELMARLFLRDEEVIGQFDVFFPERTLSSRWRFYLTIFTLGLYQVYRFFAYCCTALRHLLCKDCRECEDAIHFRRGKLIVTNLGRLVCWETAVSQSNFYDKKTYHNVLSKTEIYHVSPSLATLVSPPSSQSSGR
jgi:hypothetical protein